MSNVRPEFRPLSFPRPAAVGPTALTPATPQGAFYEDEFEADAAEADEFGPTASDAEGDAHDHEDHGGSIAGRIGHAEPPAAPHPDGEAAPGELVETLLRLGQRLRGHLDTQFGAFGLSDARFAALSVIREASPGGCTQAHLAAKLGQCESSISTLVERMRSSRLLYRLRAKADRRKRVLMLTDDGRRLFEQGLEARDREAATLFGHLPLEDRQQLAAKLGRLAATIDQMPATHADRHAA